MAGTIIITKNNRWSVSSSAYGFVTIFLVKTFSGDIYIAPVVQAFYDENINCLNVDEFTPKRQRDILQALSTQLVPYAEEQLPKDIPNRESYIDTFRDLANRAAGHLRFT